MNSFILKCCLLYVLKIETTQAVHLSGPYRKIRTAQGANQNALFQRGPLISYLTIIPRARVGYEMIDNHLISNKREWNNCFIKNNQENC